MATVERIIAFFVGALALLKEVVHGRRARSNSDAPFLRELAGEKKRDRSRPVVTGEGQPASSAGRPN